MSKSVSKVHAVSIVYDNGSKFKLFSGYVCDSFQLKLEPMTIKNPQVNTILEQVHPVVTHMTRTSSLGNMHPDMIDDLIVNVGSAICSTHHSELGTVSDVAIFGFEYRIETKVILVKNGIHRKAKNKKRCVLIL